MIIRHAEHLQNSDALSTYALALRVFCVAGYAVLSVPSPLPWLLPVSPPHAQQLQAVGGADDTEMADADVLEPQLAHKAAEDAESQEHKQSGPALPKAAELRNFSQGSRRRIYADPPSALQQQQQQQQQSLEQQLADAQAALKRMADEREAVLQQQQMEAEERAVAAAESTHRIEELVRVMEQTHVDHVARVSDPQGEGATSDATADALRVIAELQEGLLAPSGKPHFYAVSPEMVKQWTADLEVLETALGDPFVPSPYLVSSERAQTVIEQLRDMWRQLEDAPPEGLPFMQVLLFSKMLRCIEQLRPKDVEEEGQPAISWQVLELAALLARVTEHGVMWSYMLRWPCCFFESGRYKLTNRAASHYARAAMAAAPDVGQQARLLVEQCKVLERAGRLHEAQHLDGIALQYPEAPLQVLHELHTKHTPAAGPPLDTDMLKLFEARSDWSEDEWARECADAETHAAELKEQLRLDKAAGVLSKKILRKQRRRAKRARKQVHMLAARPHSFTAAMKKSLRFFHSDKRTGGAEEDAEFAQVQEAWKQLDVCRIHFEQLRAYQEQVAAVMEDTGAA